MFREIDVSAYEVFSSDYSPGPAPSLHWLPIKSLVVDHTYQREIGKKGRANVRLIAESFDWSKFAPVIVAAVEGGRYAIVDGQHRTTAAALRGIESVPCQLIIADQSKQAQAFAAVNGAITKTTPQQLFHAKLTARDEASLEIQEVCQIAGVFIARASKASARHQVGETQAVGVLARCLSRYGRDTLITALQCITQTADGNAGYVRSTIIEALCVVLNRRHDWRDAGDALLRAMDHFNFPEEWDRIADGKTVILSGVAVAALADRISEYLKPRLRTSLTADYVEAAVSHDTSSAPLPTAAQASTRLSIDRAVIA